MGGCPGERKDSTCAVVLASVVARAIQLYGPWLSRCLDNHSYFMLIYIIKAKMRATSRTRRQHVAYHLLHDDKAQLVSPCGLCGVNPQAQYGNPDLGCSVWLAKDPKGTTLNPHHICRVVGHVEYSNSCAKKFSQGQPSTNHLIACPQCPQRLMQQFFWKYRGMKEHWDRAHASFAMPSDLKQLLEIEDKERNELKKISKAKGPSRAKKRKKKEVNKAAKRMKAKYKPLPRGDAPSDIESDEEPQPTAPSTGNVEIPAGPA